MLFRASCRLLLAGVAAAYLGHPSTAMAAENQSSTIRLGIIFADGRNHQLEKRCREAETCEIYRNDDLGVTITILEKRGSRQKTSKTVRISCRDFDCFFENSQAFTEIYRSQPVRFYKGERPRGLEWQQNEFYGSLAIQFETKPKTKSPEKATSTELNGPPEKSRADQRKI